MLKVAASCRVGGGVIASSAFRSVGATASRRQQQDRWLPFSLHAKRAPLASATPAATATATAEDEEVTRDTRQVLSSTRSRFPLRDYQEAAIAASVDAFQRGVKAVAVSLPTGSGKTVILSSLIPHVPPVSQTQHKTLVLAHKIELINQTRDKVKEILPSAVVVVDSGTETSKDLHDVGLNTPPEQDVIVVASVPKLGRKRAAPPPSLSSTELDRVEASTSADSGFNQSTSSLYAYDPARSSGRDLFRGDEQRASVGRNGKGAHSPDCSGRGTDATCYAVEGEANEAIGDGDGDGDDDVGVDEVPESDVLNDSLRRYDPSEYKLIIIDEAHHAAAATYKRIIEYFQDTDTPPLIWGCSATLLRHDGVALGRVFDEIVYKLELQHLIDKGILSDLTVLRVDKEKAESEAIKRAVAEIDSHEGTALSMDVAGMLPHYHGEVTREEGGLDICVDDLEDSDDADVLEEGVGMEGSNVLPVATVYNAWLAYAAADRKSTLIFVKTTRHMDAVVGYFRKRGVDARCVAAFTPASLRATLLDGFAKRRFPVLVNIGVLTEGTDIPCIDCIMVARPVRSSVLLSQMVGRGLRTHKDKTNCLVLDCVGAFDNARLCIKPTLDGADADKAKEKNSAGEEMLLASDESNAAAAIAQAEMETEFVNDVLTAKEIDPFVETRARYQGATIMPRKLTKIREGLFVKSLSTSAADTNQYLVIYRAGAGDLDAFRAGVLVQTSRLRFTLEYVDVRGIITKQLQIRQRTHRNLYYFLKDLHEIPNLGQALSRIAYRSVRQERKKATARQLAVIARRNPSFATKGNDSITLEDASLAIERSFNRALFKKFDSLDWGKVFDAAAAAFSVDGNGSLAQGGREEGVGGKPRKYFYAKFGNLLSLAPFDSSI